MFSQLLLKLDLGKYSLDDQLILRSFYCLVCGKEFPIFSNEENKDFSCIDCGNIMEEVVQKRLYVAQKEIKLMEIKESKSLKRTISVQLSGIMKFLLSYL